MKQFRILISLMILAMVLSGCAAEPAREYVVTNQDYSVTVDPVNRTITSETETFTYTISDSGSGKSYEIVFPDGSIYYWTDSTNGGTGGWSDDFDTDRWFYADFLVSALKQNAPRQKQGSVGIGLLLMGLGAVSFFLPELPFYLRYGWAVENAEPSDAYITWSKIGGVIAALAGLVSCII